MIKIAFNTKFVNPKNAFGANYVRKGVRNSSTFLLAQLPQSIPENQGFGRTPTLFATPCATRDAGYPPG